METFWYFSVDPWPICWLQSQMPKSKLAERKIDTGTIRHDIFDDVLCMIKLNLRSGIKTKLLYSFLHSIMWQHKKIACYIFSHKFQFKSLSFIRNAQSECLTALSFYQSKPQIFEVFLVLVLLGPSFQETNYDSVKHIIRYYL